MRKTQEKGLKNSEVECLIARQEPRGRKAERIISDATSSDKSLFSCWMESFAAHSLLVLQTRKF